MNHQWLNYEGLYGDSSSPLKSHVIHLERLESRSKRYNWEIQEHLHTGLVQLFFLISGSGIVTSGNNASALKPPCIVYIPTNTLHGFQYHTAADGDVISVSESFFESIFSEAAYIKLRLDRILNFPLNDNQGALEDIQYLTKKINEEMTGKATDRIVLESLIRLLFAVVYRLREAKENGYLTNNNRTLHYFQLFTKLIRIKMIDHKPITYYAGEMNITTVHLNRICQSVTGKSALQIVHSHLITEAKNYLLHKDYSISEVAYFLNFQDPAHFSRVFKKVVGVPPGEFKRG